MTLDVLISTHGDEGLMKVEKMDLPHIKGVRYVVSWQTHLIAAIADSPLSKRDDVKIIADNSGGLSRNRNRAIAHASADICLIADNDLTYTEPQLRQVLEVFEANPDIDIATFMYEGEDNKSYPDHTFDLSQPPRGYWVTSFEIAFRREAVAKSGVKFNELFGIGAPVLGAAEEELFISQCLKAGLKGRFFPIVITRHNGNTTGIRGLNNPKVMMSKGAYHALVHPCTYRLRLAVEAYRRSRNGISPFWSSYRTFMEGARYIKKNNKK